MKNSTRNAKQTAKQFGKKAAMTNSNQKLFQFPALKVGRTRRDMEINFSGGEVSSDGGVLLLREAEGFTQISSTPSVRIKLVSLSWNCIPWCRESRQISI